MSIKAIFYSKFDIQEGPKVIHQVPEDSIVPSSALPQTAPLLPFTSISRFLIPHQSLCGNLLSLRPPTDPPCLILSYPICLKSPSYPRNEFIFNFALVLGPPDAIDVPSYNSVVTKLAHLMRGLEEQSRFLSEDTSAPGSGKIYSLCEMLMEDLNNYCECMIPIDELNTLNVKLFPTYPNPPPVKAWHVPLFTVRIETLMDENWDLTMQRIVPYIDGVRSVKKIAARADADLKLTRKCVRHLVYYGCVLLLDVFSFSAIYAPTSQFGATIARDTEMQKECARYVNKASAVADKEALVKSRNGNGNENGRLSQTGLSETREDIWPRARKGQIVDGVTIVQLYMALRQGLSVREWYTENSNMLANIDMRRFITFGVIKGFVYRVHKYAYATGAKNTQRNGVSTHGNGSTANRGTNPLPRSMSSELHLGDEDRASIRRLKDESSDDEEISDRQLEKYLDGTHPFDQMCTELEISEKDLMERIRRWKGKVGYLHR